jgi:hypothetical protein
MPFPRIDPDHPLADACRRVNAYADEHGFEETLDWLGLGDFGQIAYLGEQRLLRALAADLFGVSIGAGGVGDEMYATMATASPMWRDLVTRAMLLSIWIDGLTAGWKGHELSHG